MGVEIEHKWLPEAGLVSKILAAVRPVRIEQAYLCRRPVIRVRKDGESYYMTYKGEGMLVREEHNLPLTPAAYLSLSEKREGNMIIKDRYTVPYHVIYPERGCTQKGPEGELRMELDVFHGIHEGLFLLEIEFETKKDAEEFAAPPEFGTNVTGDPAYTNAVLSESSIKG